MSSNTNIKKKISLSNNTILFSVISILLGLIVGAIALMIAGFDPIEAYSVMIEGIIGKPKYIAWTIIKSTPLILTGLSVAFAFKTGLFNIGAEGQFIVGALAATLVGYGVQLPAIIHIPLTLAVAALAGACWGGFAGFLKSKFGVNEVISTIMLNWIAFYLNNYMVMTPWLREGNSEASHLINDSASISIDWLTGLVGPATKVNWGIIIAIILVILIAFILAKTTLGYELRGVGFNKFGAEYGGINVQSSIFKSMAIAGALAALAGAIQVIGVTQGITVLAAPEGNGFDGIAVALIANSNPIGVIFSGLLFGGLKYGGTKMQTIQAPSEVINIVIGSIVYFIALSSVVRMLFVKYINKRKQGGTE
ncbi:ABC transporter permease [[Clostridium] sordellii]|uniref:ABC transporter permease n=1 Tax=Paraclostridium sordellii TaxID=1505 RepID=A0A9P1PCM0_PARSO|nr:ABC transporter permease [Paeniclostridium sordellii]MBX9182364.1 ABC transporter permease [Paeniclostridium sordellii]CEN77013.1 ABC transporter permease [[Clostridium] sordellii] [Paeniclostridium sordellii]CEN90392.1 ABC transporter permease [[Clostridium] sordellii] [Paeniclostridium sordellii]CEO15975.1 ABC transporter permease [[Clostridium] sordellii] [Paeniclostridium sordellii]CEO31681.1 ABC transporter permease [[Clostridium] sordellii] [Paeniclostridium sordellii]